MAKEEAKRTLELKDTVSGMLSADYKERLKAEYNQAAIRLGNLEAMLDKWDAGKLDFSPTCPLSTYGMQIDAMANYIAVLEARAAMEGIDIDGAMKEGE